VALTGNEAVSTSEDVRARVAELETSVESLGSRLAQYRSVFFENPMPTVVYETESLRVIEANDSALALYGYDQAQMCSLTLIDLFAPESIRHRSELLSEFRKPVNAIGPFIHHSATKQELIVSMVSFTLGLNTMGTRAVVIQDETSRHMAEEALKASEERYRELFENANDVIFLHDLKGKILAINRAAEYLTGYSRTEVLGQSFDKLVAPEAHHQTQDSVRAHLGGSATQHYELPVVSKFGNKRYLEVSTRIIYRRGQPMAIQGIGRDITDRKNAQQRLEESSRELQLKNEELSTALRLAREATQLKEQFLANTSHELRTPMNGIMGMINLLQSTDLTPDQQEYAQAVNQCAEDLLTIINDILDMSQIEAGRMLLDEDPFNLAESTKSVIKMLSLRAHAKNLDLTYEIDPQLPEILYGDSVRVRQIMTNLIANAIKFTSTGGVRVRLNAVGNFQRVRCEVIDSGIGVSDAVRNRIFDAFFQADGTTRRRFGGTGLGLTVSKQLVEIMGGEIGTYNNGPESSGATFWFELPLRAEPVTELRSTQS
jgi:PAS domain S-box-containing protein